VNKAGLISLVEGAELVRLVRNAVEKYLQESVIIKTEKDTLEKAGVFVTLNYVTTSRKEYLYWLSTSRKTTVPGGDRGSNCSSNRRPPLSPSGQTGA
jgi:hypothetical protein